MTAYKRVLHPVKLILAYFIHVETEIYIQTFVAYHA